MCGPAPLAIGAAAMSAAGQITSGIGQAKQYRYQARIDQQNAALAN
jgi:hypothetical protein